MFDWIKRLFKIVNKKGELPASQTKRETQSLYSFTEEEAEIYSLWDFFKIAENTQAHHISSVLSFSEWITMDEIKRRITDIFGVQYKNDRSLYPYIKTLTDFGLLESTSVGGKRKWRKKDLVIKIKKDAQAKEKEALMLRSQKRTQ